MKREALRIDIGSLICAWLSLLHEAGGGWGTFEHLEYVNQKGRVGERITRLSIGQVIQRDRGLEQDQFLVAERCLLVPMQPTKKKRKKKVKNQRASLLI